MTMPSSLPRRAFLFGTAASVFLAGCSVSDLGAVIGPGPAPRIYLLRPQFPAAGGGMLPWQLAITIPEAPASIDTARIGLNPTPATLDYYADAAWPDRLPIVMQSLLLEAFENTDRVAVSRDTDGLVSDYVLRTELREFQAHYPAGGAPMPNEPAAAPEIAVRIDARLVAAQQRRVMGNVSVRRTAQAAGNDMESIVAAFDQALTGVLAEITAWTLATPPAT